MNTITKRCCKGANCQNDAGPIMPATYEYFGKDKCRPDGLSPECRICRRHRSKKSYHDNLEHHREYSRQWRAKHPGKAAEYSREWRAKSEDNRQKQREANLRWYYNNHDYALARNREWQRANPAKLYIQSARRYARKKKVGGRITAFDVKRMYKSQNGRCWYCLCDLKNTGYHIDHRIPLSRDGTNQLNNLCLSCPKCNLSKGAKLPQEWIGRLF
jgi:5-methylcytosine-specific restriction endonuclease McrA